MSKEIWSDGVSKTRPALADVTNLFGKREYSLISKSDVNTGDDYKKDEGLRFGKKERRTTENYKRENFQKEIVDCVWQPHSCSEIDSSKGNTIIIDGKAKAPSEIKEPCPPGVRHNADSYSTARSSDDAILSSPTTRLCDRDVVVLKSHSKEQIQTSMNTNYDDDLTLDNSDFNKGDSLDFSRLLESQESRSTCIEQKYVRSSSTSMDSIKACSCSFCMKAAYIWSDLHYQDIRGRIAAIKKSQKETSILVHRNNRQNEIGKCEKQSSGKFPKMESDLTNNWKSFFVNAEDIFVRESIQLESSLLTLRDLRDNCKSHLNPTN